MESGGVIKVMESSNVIVGANCILSSVANLLAKHDSTIDDAAMLFAENGFNIYYSLNGSANINDIKFKSNITNVARTFLLNRDIRYIFDYADLHNKQDDYKTNIQDLVNKYPLLAVVDSSLLQHNRVYPISPRREHVITIFNMIGNRVYFSDCYVPTTPASTFQGEMQLDLFSKVWVSTNYKYIDIDYDKVKNTIFNITNDILWKSTKENLERFILNKDEECDICGLYKFASDIGVFADKFSDQDICLNIKNLSFNIQFMGTMPILSLLKKVLLRLSLNSNFGISEYMVEQLDLLIERWRKITLMLVKAGYGISKQYFERISSYTKETVEMKESLIRKILE